MFLGMNNTRLERKILMILDFENGFLPTYLPQWSALNEVVRCVHYGKNSCLVPRWFMTVSKSWTSFFLLLTLSSKNCRLGFEFSDKDQPMQQFLCLLETLCFLPSSPIISFLFCRSFFNKAPPLSLLEFLSGIARAKG